MAADQRAAASDPHHRVRARPGDHGEREGVHQIVELLPPDFSTGDHAAQDTARRSAVNSAASASLARVRFALVFGLLLPFAAAADPAPLTAGSFVRVEGARLVVDGKPFAFVGANLAALQGERNRARSRDTVEALAHDALRVGRVWAFGEGAADAPAWSRNDHLFRAGPDGFIEEAYQQLDRLLDAARKQGIRLIVTLCNQWSDYGGIPMYLRWAGRPENDAVAFYRDEKVRGWFRAGIEKLLTRKNHLTGVAYVDDPTIFSWELMNESNVVTDEQADARRDWIVAMARFIKARDPNHLVAAGVGGYQSQADRREWIRVHRLPEIDYCDSHLYPQSTDGVDTWRRLTDFIDDRAQLAAHVIKKPLVIGEFGFHTDGDEARFWKRRPRAEWFARFLDRLAFDGVSGALVWIYQPWAGAPRDFGIYTDRHDTDDIRHAIADRAARVARRAPSSTNPRLRASIGERPLYDPLVAFDGPVAARHDDWLDRGGGERLLEIPPAEFLDARFERAGYWDRSALSHVYGVGHGRFRYRFTAPPSRRSSARAPAQVIVRARLSSEWPGTNLAPPGGGSPVEVQIDGVPIAAFAAATDDGAGTLHEITITDPRLLGRLAAGRHLLTLSVPDRPGAHGLCVYGAPTGIGRPPVGEALPLQVVYRSARPPTAQSAVSQSAAQSLTPRPLADR